MNGGYILKSNIEMISLYDILKMSENSFNSKFTLNKINLYPEITESIISTVNKINNKINNELKSITVKDISNISEYISSKNIPMYYI